MKKTIRLFLFGALALIVLTACAGQEGSPTAIGTTGPGTDFTATPFATDAAGVGTAETATGSPEATLDTTSTALPSGTDTTGTLTTQTASIPVTGLESVLLPCQFCINGVAHAMLVLPDTATFEVLSQTASVAPTTDAASGCNTVDTLDGNQIVLCRGQENTAMNLNICAGANCQQLTVTLQSCPQTLEPGPKATNTPGADVIISTATPGTGAGTGATTDTPPAVIPTATP